MCLMIIFRRTNQDQAREHPLDRLMSRLFPVGRASPPQNDGYPVALHHQTQVGDKHQRSDSLTLPKYAGFRERAQSLKG
jgi:hypothetical protein